MLHPALLLGEGDGDVTGEADVGNEDDEDAGPDDGAVAVESGADGVDTGNEALMGGLGVIERLWVGALTEPVEVGDSLELVAAPEADEELNP